MVYVFDTSSFIVLGHYYPDRFPAFWAHLNALADNGSLASVSEVWKELDNRNTRDHLATWLAERKGKFATPSTGEMEFVAKIFAVRHFQALLSKKQIYQGKPAADPWVIAKAAVTSEGCVISEETEKKNAARIPTVCSHFGVKCLTLEGLMRNEGWKY